MTTRNWRVKSNRAGCNMFYMCEKNNTVDNYIPNTLTISPFISTRLLVLEHLVGLLLSSPLFSPRTPPTDVPAPPSPPAPTIIE